MGRLGAAVLDVDAGVEGAGAGGLLCGVAVDVIGGGVKSIKSLIIQCRHLRLRRYLHMG